MADEYRIANLEIRPSEKEVLVDGVRIGLTVREFQLFTVLAAQPDRVLQRPEIFTAVWGSDMRRRDRSIDVLVRKVRAKLDRAAPGWQYIHTHFGVGYRFHPVRKDGYETVDHADDSDPAPVKRRGGEQTLAAA
jgi:DNA-binding response OmpR family regulator